MNTNLKLLALAIGTLTSASTLAEMSVNNFSINIGAINVSPNDSSTSLNVVESVAGLPAGSTAVGVNSNTQLGLTVDYQIDKNWTVELIAATPFSHDIEVEGSAIDGLDIGNTKQLPPTLLAQYHFDLGDSKFDPFIGVGLNYTKFFDATASGALKNTLQALKVATANDDVDLKLTDSWGLAVQAGVNYELDKHWGLHLMVSKMDIDTTGEVRLNDATIQSVDVQIDPLVVMAGVRWSM